jgi:hypothetical protein
MAKRHRNRRGKKGTDQEIRTTHPDRVRPEDNPRNLTENVSTAVNKTNANSERTGNSRKSGESSR